METTTIEIYLEDLPWWRKNCKVKKLNSRDCFREFKNSVNRKKQQEFYSGLPKPENYRHPLLGKKIKVVDKYNLAKKL